MLPAGVRQSGGVVTVLICAPLRRNDTVGIHQAAVPDHDHDHALTENQPINQDWDARLASISDKFRTFGTEHVVTVRLLIPTDPAARRNSSYGGRRTVTQDAGCRAPQEESAADLPDGQQIDSRRSVLFTLSGRIDQLRISGKTSQATPYAILSAQK
ncbi:MAG: hypothetical protein ABSC06_19710 [Rhodopila sp.]|jgi:hypothetical protein